MAKAKPPVHPGTILLEQVMTPLGVSRNQLARDIDVPVGRISDITNGKRSITADTALRLARYFGTDAELWMRLQAEYDLQIARGGSWPAIEPRVRVIGRKGEADDVVPASGYRPSVVSSGDAAADADAASDAEIPPAPHGGRGEAG